MLILIQDKNTKRITNNMGCIGLCIDGREPEIVTSEHEEIIRLDEQSELTSKILLAHEWEPVYDSDGNLIDVTVLRTKEDEDKRQNILSQLSELDKIVTRPQENIIAFLVQSQNYQPYATELSAIQQKQLLRQELALLEV